MEEANEQIEKINREMTDLKRIFGANTLNFMEFMECLNIFALGLSKAIAERERAKERQKRR